MKAIKAKKLYNGLGEFTENPILIIEDNIIKDILNRSNYEKLKHYKISEEIDYSDSYLMPGLIDCHTHLMLPGDGTTTEEILSSKSRGEIALLAGLNAQKALKSGVTSIRDCGCALGVSYDVKNFILSGYTNGPDIVVCGMPMTSSCGHLSCMGGAADGSSEIVKLIRQQRMEGCDFVKLIASSGASKGVKPGLTFTQYELNTATEEAHRLNMKVSVHATSIEAVKMAVEAGADRIEHGWWMDIKGTKVFYDAELAKYLIENDIMTCSTLPVMKSTLKLYINQLKIDNNEEIRKQYDSLKSYNDVMLETFKYEYSLGIPMASGSDSGWRHMSFSDGMKDTITEMYDCGVNLNDIIKICTGNAARYIGMEDTLGSLEKGKKADFLVMKYDPGKTIDAYNNITQIYKRGLTIL